MTVITASYAQKALIEAGYPVSRRGQTTLCLLSFYTIHPD